MNDNPYTQEENIRGAESVALASMTSAMGAASVLIAGAVGALVGRLIPSRHATASRGMITGTLVGGALAIFNSLRGMKSAAQEMDALTQQDTTNIEKLMAYGYPPISAEEMAALNAAMSQKANIPATERVVLDNQPISRC